VVSIAITNGTTANTASVSPASFPRLVAISDAFQFYRFLNLKVTIPPFLESTGSAAYTGRIQVGFVPGGGVTTAFSTPLEVSELECGNYNFAALAASNPSIPGASTVYRSFRVPRKVLLSDVSEKWYKTKVASGVEDWQEIQGFLVCSTNTVSGSGTIITPLMVQYEIEFAGDLPISVILKSRAEKLALSKGLDWAQESVKDSCGTDQGQAILNKGAEFELTKLKKKVQLLEETMKNKSS